MRIRVYGRYFFLADLSLLTNSSGYNILKNMASRIALIDIYTFRNPYDGNILESLMYDSNISCKINARFAQRFDDDDFLEKSISVEKELADNARNIIRVAINSGILSAEGRFKT